MENGFLKYFCKMFPYTFSEKSQNFRPEFPSVQKLSKKRWDYKKIYTYIHSVNILNLE